MGKVRAKFSTRFFCRHCKKEDGRERMLYLDAQDNSLKCRRHPEYVVPCTCKMSDMIILDVYPETEEEKERLLLAAEELNKENEESLEVNKAKELKELIGEDVRGFSF